MKVESLLSLWCNEFYHKNIVLPKEKRGSHEEIYTKVAVRTAATIVLPPAENTNNLSVTASCDPTRVNLFDWICC